MKRSERRRRLSGEGLTLKVNIDPGKLPLAQAGAQLESEPPTDHPLHR